MSAVGQSIFDVSLPRFRSSDPETSQTAAEIAGVNAKTNRELALKTLRAHSGGLTDFELAEKTGVAQTSIGVRRHELVKLGLVAKTDRRRASPSGSPAIVWIAMPLFATQGQGSSVA